MRQRGRGNNQERRPHRAAPARPRRGRPAHRSCVSAHLIMRWGEGAGPARTTRARSGARELRAERLLLTTHCEPQAWRRGRRRGRRRESRRRPFEMKQRVLSAQGGRASHGGARGAPRQRPTPPVSSEPCGTMACKSKTPAQSHIVFIHGAVIWFPISSHGAPAPSLGDAPAFPALHQRCSRPLHSMAGVAEVAGGVLGESPSAAAARCCSACGGVPVVLARGRARPHAHTPGPHLTDAARGPPTHPRPPHPQAGCSWRPA